MGFMDGFLRKKTSGNTAKDRLKLVLVSDRANCSPETMELDGGHGNVPSIYANIPIKELRSPR